MGRRAATLAVFALCVSCQPAPPGAEFGSGGSIWDADDLEGWRVAWIRSCERQPWKRLPSREHRSAAPVDAAAWAQACEETPPGAGKELRRWLAARFSLHAVEAAAFVTGYFEPHYEGRLQPEGPFTTPLLRPPSHLSAVLEAKGRYFDRAAIERGALAGRGLELVWLKPADAFFLQIQGSGVVRVPDQAPLRVGYAGNNGHAYHAIGGDLIDRGIIAREEMSMQRIRAWLEQHPAEGRALMQRNPRYIFFRLITGEGPIGAAGIALTPERSLAVDPAHIPYGLPVWVEVSPHPGTRASPLQRLTIAQDTGAAIRGAGRADFFWGGGTEAGELAGRMKARGRLYLLLPRAGFMK